MPLKPTNIPNLTPLRGIAALLVAVFHFNAIGATFVNANKTMLIEKCYLMVDLFFIMSGFVMLHVYGNSFSKTIDWPVFKKFIKARFARLYPLHFFTLAIAVVLFYAGNNPPSPIENPSAIATHLLLLQSFGIHKIFTWNVPSWSISAEWWSYIIFPLGALFLSKNKKATLVVMLLLSTSLYFAIEYFLPRVNPFAAAIPVPHNLDVTYDYGFLRGFAGFMLGTATYTQYQNKNLHTFLSKDVVAICCIVAIFLTMHFGLNDLINILLFALLVLTVAANKNALYKITTFKPLQYLGDISYSIYLVHSSLIFFVAVPIFQELHFIYKGPGSLQLPFFTGLGICCIFLVAAIVVSSITYYAIERPFRKWINKSFVQIK